jgi:thiamine pyrophosphate-dependent acetolactate synthase large subunit-like protein
MPDDGSVFGRPDFAAIARGFGLQGKTFTSLSDLSKAVQEFGNSRGAAVWDFHVSDKILSPTIRKAHPPGKHAKG